MEAVQGRLAELSGAGLALECSQWLDQLSQQLRQLGGRLLGPCASGQGLLAVEAAVKEALGQWQYALQALAGGAAEAAAAGEPPAAAMSWGDVCLWVLGRACPLWPLLFEQPLLERAKELVSGDFGSLLDEVASLLRTALQVGRGSCCCSAAQLGQACGGCSRFVRSTAPQPAMAGTPCTAGLSSAKRWHCRKPCGGGLPVLVHMQEASSLPPSAPGSTQAGSWSDVFEFFELQPGTPDAAGTSSVGGSKRRRLAGRASGGAGAGGQRGGPAAAAQQEWLPRAEQLVQRFDQQLGRVLAAALDACGGTSGGHRDAAAPAGAGNAGQKRSSGSAEAAASRTFVLEPFVQDRWALPCGAERRRRCAVRGYADAQTCHTCVL